MKKLIISFVASMMMLFIIWTAIGYKYYGNDLINHHLNIQAMFIRFKNQFVSYNILDDLKNIQTLTKTFSDLSLANIVEHIIQGITGVSAPQGNDIFSFIVNAFNILVSPLSFLMFGTSLLIYITGSSLMLAITFVDILVQILQFVFMPIFI